MKRKDAFRKLRTVCQRLDDADPEQFPVIPLRLYLFGSLLTDKPNPSDVDLLFEFRDRPDLDPDDMLYRLSYGKPLPHDQAVVYLRRGMQMIRLEYLVGDLKAWLADRYFPPDTPLEVVWEPGLAWSEIVGKIEAQPLPWDPAAEERYDRIQETCRRIADEQGLQAVQEWLAQQSETAQSTAP